MLLYLSAFAQLVCICINEKCDEFKIQHTFLWLVLLNVAATTATAAASIVLERFKFMWQTFAGDSIICRIHKYVKSAAV